MKKKKGLLWDCYNIINIIIIDIYCYYLFNLNKNLKYYSVLSFDLGASFIKKVKKLILKNLKC